MKRYYTYAAAMALVTGVACGQMLNELEAVQGGQNQLNSMGTGGANVGSVDQARNVAGQPPAYPPTGTVGGPSVGVGLPPPGGLPAMPGAPGAVATPLAGYPGLSGPTTFGARPQAGGTPTPTPIPTIKVLVGKRVYCSVCGTLLEDPIQLAVPQSQQDRFLDDGVHDNGIAQDGIRGNVETVKDKYIGAECNGIKNRLINVVRHAEDLDPMHFYGYHIMALDPITAHPDMPQVLVKEEQRDEALRDWNNKFLADYRIDKNDPKSEFYQLYVPEPPLPPAYPKPPGYQAPQKLSGTTGPGGVPVGTPNIFNGDPVIDVPM